LTTTTCGGKGSLPRCVCLEWGRLRTKFRAYGCNGGSHGDGAVNGDDGGGGDEAVRSARRNTRDLEA
jgi:hypothetical protein